MYDDAELSKCGREPRSDKEPLCDRGQPTRSPSLPSLDQVTSLVARLQRLQRYQGTDAEQWKHWSS